MDSSTHLTTTGKHLKHEKKSTKSLQAHSMSILSSSGNRFLSHWDRRFLRIAEEVRLWSKDPGTKVGCVLVSNRRILSTGYNGFPQTISDNLERYIDREYKLSVTIHAEANAILNAAKNGTKVEGSTLYVTFPPCSQCASAVIQAGVAQVVCPDPAFAPERWRSNFVAANNLFYEAGVKVLYYSDADLCLTETAPSVGHTGLMDNSTGPPASPAKTKTLTRSFAEDFLRKRQDNA
jgi:dCMP deaminase